ncbi:MAG: metallophosphoesterase [Alistipes sp.]|nr:metallophosphoesterase [Alistipes sp.]
MSNIRILHISDIHLTDQGVPIWGVNTMDNFHRLIERIKKLSNIDAIIISGDISNDGTEWTYKYVDKTFQAIGIPTYWCMGNHDNLERLKESASFCQYVPEFCISNWGFIFLNSVIPDEDSQKKNKARGYLGVDQLEHIKEAARKYDNLAIVMHHPPVETGGWLDRRILEDRESFKREIESLGNVKLVMYGHIHCFTNSVQNGIGITYTSAPAISYAFNNKLAKFEIDFGSEGYNVIEIENSVVSVEYHILINI